MGTKNNKAIKKYAKMLFNITGVKKAEKVCKQLSLLNKLIMDKKIKNFFISPAISEDERKKGIDIISEKLSLFEEVKKFIIFLVNKGAITELEDILKYYTELYFEKKQKVKATVIMPIKVSNKYKKKILTSLKKLTEKDVEVEYLYDSNLIGGIIVKIGSKMYDSSIRGQLRLLKEELIKG